MTHHPIDADLFPPPAHQSIKDPGKNVLAPRIWPGVSPTSASALQGILTDNHKRFHVFFNAQRFHNHSAHAVLTLWCLGGDASILEASYRASSAYQRPVVAPPNEITHATWRDYLGDERYYQAYLNFFISEVKVKSFATILEEYVFALDANFVNGATKQPEMLNRFFEALVHAMIHTGFGVEFGLPGTFAEGLSMTAVHAAGSSAILPEEMFKPSDAGLSARFAQSVGLTGGGSEKFKDVHAFTILGRVLADPRLAAPPKPELFNIYIDAMKRGDILVEYANEWTLEGDLQKKVEELVWTNALIYGVGGSEPSGEFNADFFYMHLVTSSLFISSIFSLLKRNSQVILLRGYFSVCLAWWVARGRPELDLERFFKNPTTVHPTAPGPQPTPHKDASPSPTSPQAITPNSWLQIIQTTLTHPDDHLAKLQRSLSDYAMHFGDTPPGTFADTELKGSEFIDGTLFIRAAGLTATRMGWVREGEPSHETAHGDIWDFGGFYNDSEV